MFGFFKKKPAVTTPEPDASLIVPRIKHTNFLVALRDIVKKEDDAPVTEPLVADLLVTYAFDLPQTFQMVCVRDAKRLGLSVEQMRAAAVENLKQQLGNIGREGEPPVMKMVVGNNLEACVILVDEIWQSLADKIPPEMIIGVPTRDVLLVSSTKSGPEGIQQLRDAVKAARTGDNTHWLTDQLLVRRADKWEVYNDAA
jgi:uncharacterized protein YtpQ (UPF0354 family)